VISGLSKCKDIPVIPPTVNKIIKKKTYKKPFSMEETSWGKRSPARSAIITYNPRVLSLLMTQSQTLLAFNI